jgi:hypothetical protein
MFVRTNASATSMSSRVRRSRSPGAFGIPSNLGSSGCATSPSTSSTVLSISIAMLIARLSAVNVLPSPGKALVTMTRLPFLTFAPEAPCALRMIGT